MERAVGTLHDAGVAHHLLLAHLRTQEHALNAVPSDAVVAVDKPQSLGGWFMKRCADIDVFCQQRWIEKC